MKTPSIMRKLSVNRMMLFILLFSTTLLFTACSSSDNDDDFVTPPSSSYKEILGTFKGTLTTYNDPSGIMKHYDAELIITDAGNGKIKIAAKPNQPYSFITSKEIKVNPVIDGYIQGIEAEGDVSYSINQNYLIVVTEKSKETDIDFSFEGSKIK